MNFLVLAGGSGTRLFPLSRKNYPKQFIKTFNGGCSLFQKTLFRAIKLARQRDSLITIWVVTNKQYQFFVKSQVDEVLTQVDRNSRRLVNVKILYEPASKNTAPAIAYAIRVAVASGVGLNEVFFVSPSDHYMADGEDFVKCVLQAEHYCRQGYIVTFGIKPTVAHTGYGYIKQGKLIGENCFKVDAFTEKPNQEVARKYLNSDAYYWNSGMFVFTGETIKREFLQHCNEIGQLFLLEENVDEYFDQLPDLSIDYAVMEKSENIAMVVATFNWSDVGGWDTLYDISPKDEYGNVKVGNVYSFDSQSNLVLGNGRKVVTLGVKDLIIVETPDVVLVSQKGQTEKVKQVVATLKAEGDSSVDNHVTDYRPWGSFTLLEEDTRYKIKKIVVTPGGCLSLQMHHHRSEHWVVVKGTAKVTIGNDERFIHENESVFIPKSTPHRLSNPGKVPLEIIEVQVGEYVGEDDIVRFDDLYGRA